MLCSDALLIKHERNRIAARILKCRSWSCEICYPDRVRQLVAQCLGGAPTMFLTLTVNPTEGTDANSRARELSRCWAIIRRRAMVKYGYPEIPFIAVFERTKNGEPHLHILARCEWIGKRWLSAQMAALAAAPIVDVQAIKSKRKAARYVSKYVGKDPHRFEGVKRYWCSRDWEAKPRPVEEAEPGYTTYEVRWGDTLSSFADRIGRLYGQVIEEDGWVFAQRENWGQRPEPPPACGGGMRGR